MFVIFKCFFNLKARLVNDQDFLSGCFRIIGKNIPALSVLLLLRICLFWWRRRNNQPYLVPKEQDTGILCIRTNDVCFLTSFCLLPQKRLSLFYPKIKQNLMFEQKLHDQWYPETPIKDKPGIKPQCFSKCL